MTRADDISQEPPSPLQGIKVIDWTIWQFGPVAATMLGDLGADVIKSVFDNGRWERGRLARNA